jgi:hypothetical protein
MRNRPTHERAIQSSQEKMDKAVSSARKLLGALNKEVKNPMANKPIRYAVVAGGITYFAYLYLHDKKQGAGEFQAGAVIDGQRIEMGGSFSTSEVQAEDGTSTTVLEPTIEPGVLSDDEIDVLDAAVSGADIEPILPTPENSD